VNEKIDICTEIAKKQRFVDSEFTVNSLQYTIFLMFGLRKFSPNIDKVQILITNLHF